jgi:hypothetical protein
MIIPTKQFIGDEYSCEKRWMIKIRDGSGNDKIDVESSEKDNQGGKK